MLELAPLPFAVALAVIALVGCHRSSDSPTPGAMTSAATSATVSSSARDAHAPSPPHSASGAALDPSTPNRGDAPPPAAATHVEPATVDRLDVPGQSPAWVVRSRDGSPPRVVFLPGICSNAGAYLYGFTEAARTFGGALAIDGDRPCGGGGDFHSITSDPTHEQPRIDRALAAAGWPDPEHAEVVLVGYSLGATLVENLVRQSPGRYPRVALIGSPRDPQLARLRGALAVATLSCSLDVPQRMKGAALLLERAGIAARYLEMPGCTHGNLADGDRVFADLFGWLAQAGRKPDEAAPSGS
jgi:pimeloyl-ACP methyl ester carboxylesterase